MTKVAKTVRVLLIEDSLTDAILLEKVLTRMSSIQCDLKIAKLLEEGLNHIKQDCIDIILLDLSLPDSYDLESLREIQNITKTVPIIVLTGTENDQMAIASLREGAQDYLVKDDIINSTVFSNLLHRAIAHAIERKQIMEQLRHNEALYRGVIEDQSEFICRFFPDGAIFLANQAFSRYLGINSAQLLKQDFFLLIAESDLALVTPSIGSLSPEIPNITVEFRGKKSSQEYCWQQWNIRAIFQGSKIVEYQAVGQDISDYKEAEIEKARLIASLQESKEQFSLVTDSAPVLIWMTNLKGKLTFVNQFWLNFTGKSLEQTLIEDWMINVHFQDRQKLQITYQKALRNRSDFDIEYRLLNHKGQYSWIFNKGVPRFSNQGQFVGFVCSGIDISKRKTAEHLLEAQVNHSYTLAEITKHIHESLDLREILKTTTEELQNFFNAETTAIVKIDSAKYCQIFSPSTDVQLDNRQSIRSTFIPSHWKIKNYLANLQAGEIILINSLNPDQEAGYQPIVTEKLPPSASKTAYLLQELDNFNCFVILVPIIVEKTLWGIFGIEQLCLPRRWNTEEIKLLEQITRQVAIAIKQAELYHTIEETNKKLVELTVVDGLTKIANRRKFDQYLESEWKRLAREKLPLSLIMCDIDHFKLYNDTYGHQAGDRCLQQVAQAIKNAVKRPADLTARYGGEEIAIILPNTTPKGAEKVAKSIRQQIQALHIPHINSKTDMYVTLSVGVAGCIPQNNCSVEGLLAKADSNLYKAKNTGRNRVVSE